VKNTLNANPLRDLYEHWGVLDINYLPGWHLGNVQRKPKDVRVGLADVDEAGGDKKIHKPVQLKLSDPILIQFPRFVANDNNLQAVMCLKSTDQLDHLEIRFRLREHKTSKLITCEWPLLVEDHQP
jgi:hypothetical protein